MDLGVDPEYFGCGNKVGYFETLSFSTLSGANGASDYSAVSGLEPAVISIDKIYQCAADPKDFAAIAINHAINDVLVALAKPLQISIGFEFNRDLRSAQRASIVSAFVSELKKRRIAVGKCHSSFGEITSVTIAVVAKVDRVVRPKFTTGRIELSRPLGYFKMHYLHETGQLSGLGSFSRFLTDEFSAPTGGDRYSAISDVSGHGLAGTLHSLAIRHSLDIDVSVGAELVAHPLVLEMPTPCLLTDFSEFAANEIAVDVDSWRVVGLRETAGPLIGLVNSSGDVEEAGGDWPRAIGHFAPGEGRLRIAWEE